MAAQRRLGERAAVTSAAREPLKAAKRKRKGKGKDTVPMPARPESLDHSIDVTRLPPQRIREELDRVVAYLAAGPSKAEREVLEIELPFLEEAAGKERTKAEATERGERMSKALTPTSGNEESQFMELLRRVQGAERVSQDVWLLHYDNKVFPIDPRELVDLREKVGAGLTSGARAVDGAMYDVEGAWKERHQKAREHKVVHRLARFTSGVEEISAKDIENMISVAGMYTRRVSTAGQGGSLVYAGEQLLVFDAYAKYWANKVGEWESGLMHGAGNWAIALTIVKEALTIWAGIGAAKLASAAGGGFLGAMQAGAKITAVTTGTGMVAGGVGAGRVGDRDDSDLVREPNRPPSVPTGAAFEPRDSARYRDAGTTSGGTSGARIVVDTTSGRKYVFKPVSNELEVPRAQDRGIQQGEYAPRAKAAELASEALGLKTPAVELVQIGKDRGSLTEWVEMESLADYITRDPAGFAELRRKPEFKAAQDAIDTLDYLINQVDRAQNKGNYLIEFHPDGRFKSLIPIDSELSFTSTRERAKVGAYANDLPATMSPEMVARLERLGSDREAFVKSIRPLVGDEAIPGVLERLDALLVWSKGGAAASPAPGASRGASSSRGATSSGGTGKP